MEKYIVGKNFDLGDALRTHINDSLQRIVAKYFNEALIYHVVVEKSHLVIHTALEIHMKPGMIIHGDATNEDPYTSVDLAIHKIENNLRRYKNRIKAHHSKHDISKEEKAIQYILHDSYRNLEGKEETDEDHKEAAIIAETAAYIPTISVSEAVMRIDLSGHNALLFRNKEHNGLNMVYVRKDGNIGWIDPEGNKKD